MLCMIAVPQEIKVFISKKKSKAHTPHDITYSFKMTNYTPHVKLRYIHRQSLLDFLSKGNEGYSHIYDSDCYAYALSM